MTAEAAPVKPAKPKWTGWHWRVAIGGLLVMIGGSIALSGMSFFHPYVIEDLFVGQQSTFLLYYTVMLVVVVLSMMLIGRPLLAKVGAKKLMYAGTGIVAVALVAFSVSTANVLTFYLSGALLGIGYGISFQLVPVIWVNNWFVADKGTALGIVMGGTGVGGMLWALAVPGISGTIGWRTAYLMAAVVVLVFPIIGTAFFVKNHPAEVGLTALGANAAANRADVTDPEDVPGYSYAEALRSVWVWLIMLAILMLGIAHGGAQILAIYMQSTTAVYTDPTLPLDQQPPSETAFFSTLMMTWTLGLLVFKPLLGYLNDKLGLLGAMLLTLGMQSLSFLFLPHWSSTTPLVLLYGTMIFMAAGMSNGTVQPPLLFSGCVGNRAFGQIWSFFGGGYLIGCALGAPLWGMIRDVTGAYTFGFNSAWVLLMGCAVISYWAMKQGEQDYAARYEAQRAQKVAVGASG